MQWDNPSPETITRLQAPPDGPKSAFLYRTADDLVLRDLVSGKQWRLTGDSFEPLEGVSCPPLRRNGYRFSYDEAAGKVLACKGEDCISADIQPGTWVYTFARYADRVLALTNYGDALLFRDGSWCRMIAYDDHYFCSDKARMLTKPRKVQFYTSVRYNGQTLVGEWPTGRIFEFNGWLLRPWEHQPPFVSGERVGYEVQSLVSYCGALYAGYWPTGEIWKRSSRGWTKLVSLFSQPKGSQSFIPYADRERDEQNIAFYGRRIPALVPFRGDLYAVTSNLRGWYTDFRPDFLSDQEIAEYGAVYRISRQGCETHTE